jgi:hypothetical protein
MSSFNIGSRVRVSVPATVWGGFGIKGGTEFTATVTRVVCPCGALGGLFAVRADDGRKFADGADWMAGDWLQPIDADADAAVAVGGGN